MDVSQLRTILWLRWRLTRNQWSRNGPLNAAVTMLVAGIGLVIGMGGAVGGLLAGMFLLTDASPAMLLVVWDVLVGAFLFFWMIGIVNDIQRSESIDISRLLHLPISLRGVFWLNYLASHLTFSIILFVPGMLGLAVGLVFGKGWFMMWLVPLLLGVVSMVTAWTYCLRGWLVTLMTNQRRRRAVIAAITFSFVLLSQLPYILSHVFDDHKRHRPRTVESSQAEKPTATGSESRAGRSLPPVVLAAHRYVPLLWVGNGAMSLGRGDVRPAILGGALAFLIGGLGLRRAYRSTLRFYEGPVTGKRSARRAKAERTIVPGRNFLARQLPGVPPDAAALALAFFRSLTRAPEVKMALATNFIMLLVFGGMLFVRRASGLADGFKPLAATGAVALAFFGMLGLMFNQFGYDRDGFRTLVLSPVPRERILLGKNLALLPFAVGFGVALLVVAKFAFRIPSVFMAAAGLQLIGAFLLLSTVGNLVSVLVPYRIAPGSMKPTKTSSLVMVLIALSHVLFPTAMIPIFVPAVLGLLLSRWCGLPAGAVMLLSSAILLGLLIVLYRLSLSGLGDLLQRREKAILKVVTEEVE